MKLELLDNIKETILYERRASPTKIKYVNFDIQESKNTETYEVQKRYRLELEYMIWAKPDSNFEREKAVRAFCNALYGDVQGELIEVLHMLWEEGDRNSKPAKRIENLINTLEGGQ